MKIAIVGAGFSGCHLYNLLQNQHDVTIFEKSRGAGGRCSTRYIEDKKIDHGTPFFQATNKEFQKFSEDKVKENILKYQDGFYYPTDGINKVCSSLIQKEHLCIQTKIVACDYKDKKWTLKDQNNQTFKKFDLLLLTIPAPQVLELKIDISQDISKKLLDVTYDSIGTLILYSNTTQSFDSKLFPNKFFKKVINNSSKYNYKEFKSFVLHLKESLTNKQDFQNKDAVLKYMLELLNKDTKLDIEKSFDVSPHFWKYAFVKNPIEQNYLYDQAIALGLCGDYFMGENLQSAFLSSKRLYEEQLSKEY